MSTDVYETLYMTNGGQASGIPLQFWRMRHCEPNVGSSKILFGVISIHGITYIVQDKIHEPSKSF